MTNKIKILIAIGAILTIAVGFGLYKFVRFQIAFKQAISAQEYRINILDEFLTKSFPEQVEAYVKAKNEALPASPATE